MTSNIGGRIMVLRKHNNLSQQSFGENINVTKSHISNIERGKDRPSNSLIKLIAMEYNVNEEWLKFGTGPMEVNSTSKEDITEIQYKSLLEELNEVQQRLSILSKELEQLANIQAQIMRRIYSNKVKSDLSPVANVFEWVKRFTRR